jgi:hypothetical protein
MKNKIFCLYLQSKKLQPNKQNRNGFVLKY